MGTVNLEALDAWDPESGALNVIIETSKGSRNKLRYNPDQRLFELSKVLPRGTTFPFDFGFVPSTLGDDGDPLDILVLMDEPVPAGCKVPVRLIGVIEAKQTEDGQTERNDRLLAVAEHCHDYDDTRSAEDLGQAQLKEIEHFFISYNEMAGKRFKPLGCRGPQHAEKLVQKGVKRFRQQGARAATPERNGKQKSRKQ